MMKFLKRMLGIDLLEYRLEVTLEELSQDDVKIADRVRRMEKDFLDLIVYLKVKREEEWKEDKKNPLNMPKVVSSKWKKIK